MIYIDGAMGEGGGQVLRTSLGLAARTGAAFTLTNIRAGRAKPGLLRQHLTSVRAAAAVCGAEVEGDALGSTTLVFVPGPLRGGAFDLDIGSAGSTTLVLQTVLPALLAAPAPSTVRVGGGTHNPAAPPWHAFEHSFLAALRRMGADVRSRLTRYGFVPQGGGAVVLDVAPGDLRPVSWLDAPSRTSNAEIQVTAAAAGEAALRVAKAEIAALHAALRGVTARVEVVASPGPGHATWAAVPGDGMDVVFSAIGMGREAPGVVADAVVAQLDAWRQAAVPVDEHLADQLLIPMALAGGGAFRTTAPSLHTTTNVSVIQRFLDVSIRISPDGPAWRVEVRAA